MVNGFRVTALNVKAEQFFISLKNVNGRKIRVSEISNSPKQIEFIFLNPLLKKTIQSDDVYSFFNRFINPNKLKYEEDYIIEVLE